MTKKAPKGVENQAIGKKIDYHGVENLNKIFEKHSRHVFTNKTLKLLLVLTVIVFFYFWHTQSLFVIMPALIGSFLLFSLAKLIGYQEGSKEGICSGFSYGKIHRELELFLGTRNYAKHEDKGKYLLYVILLDLKTELTQHKNHGEYDLTEKIISEFFDKSEEEFEKKLKLF